MKITAFDDLYPNRAGVGSGVVYVSSGSNTSDGDVSGGGDVTGDPGDYSVVGLRRTVSLASNIGGGTVGDVLTIIGTSPRLAMFATPSNSGVSFGSNSTRVSEVAAAGAATAASRADHIHDGIGQITASSSNTLQRGTFNLRAGNNVSIGYTDGDGDGELDTATIHATGGGGGGGGGGAPTTAPYVTTAADGGLSAEVVIPGVGVPDRVPASPSAYDDEFDADSGWTTLGSMDDNNTTDWPSHLHLRKASVGLQIHGRYKAAPSVPYAAVVKWADYSIQRGNYTEYGVAVGDSTPTAWCSFSFSSYLSSNQRDTWTNNTTRASAANDATDTLRAMPRYMCIAVNSATSIHYWWSHNGMTWNQAYSAVNPGFTPSKVGLVVSANGVEAEGWVDYVRFYTGTAGQTFNVSDRAWA